MTYFKGNEKEVGNDQINEGQFLPFGPAVELLGLHPKKPETVIQKNLCTPMFIEAQFTIAKCWDT